MRFTVDHSALAPALATVARAIPARAVRPILSAVLLVAQEGRLTLCASDLETTIVAALPAAIEEEGRAAVPARYLTDLLRRIPSGSLTAETDPEAAGLRIAWGRTHFTIHGHNPTDYPAMPLFPATSDRRLAQGVLRHALQHTTFAAAQGETARALLTGVELRFATDTVFALATDGFQAASYASDRRAPRPVDNEVVVPAAILQEVGRLLSDADQPCEIARHGTQILFRAGDTYLASRVLEGKYFPVLDLVPKDFPTTVRLPRETLLGACERVGVVCDADPPHAVTVDVRTGQLELNGASAEVGSAREVLEAQVTGPEVHLGFNVRQLAEGLRRLAGGDVLLEISSPSSLARVTDPEDGRLQYLQMPLQMTE